MKKKTEEKNRISVKRAAELLGASEQFIRIGMQKKQLNIGVAVKNKNSWSYVITKQLFEKETRIKVPDEESQVDKEGAE